MSLMVFALATALCALTKRPPSRFVMSDKRTPLRQIHFTGQGFAVVHHRLTTYNCTIPPFVAELRAKKTTNPVASPVPTDLTIVADDVPPAFDNEIESSGSDGMADESSSDGESHSGDHSDSDISHGDTMDEIESAITVRSKYIGLSVKHPNFRWTLLAMMPSRPTVFCGCDALFLVSSLNLRLR